MVSEEMLAEKKVVNEKEKELTVGQVEAWRAVGSPARRASINPESIEDFNAPEIAARARAASIPGFSFQANKEGPPPPGFGDNVLSQPVLENKHVESVWSSNVPSIWANGKEFTEEDDFAELSTRISREKMQDYEMMSEEEYASIAKGRSRSKSSSAIFGISEEAPIDPRAIPDMSSIWADNGLLHRRASTQPNQQSLMWEALKAAQLSTPSDLNGIEADLFVDKFKNELPSSRRFSVAPSMVNRFMVRNTDVDTSNINGAPTVEAGRRRHSMTGPLFDFDKSFKMQTLSEGLEALGLDDPDQHLEEIDDYFENTTLRAEAFKEAGKNLLAGLHTVPPPVTESVSGGTHYEWPIYVIEFKAGRTDYFYLPKDSKSLQIGIGDLAIVEADRGKDLGKVIENNIMSLEELQLYQSTHIDPLVDSHNAVGQEITPKKIYRLAEASEAAVLLTKSQDESKAKLLCQTRIRQKKLPMEVVDAEYQWDRRKLTFYFVADRRIDFRELVRELFKIYKTRIWM